MRWKIHGIVAGFLHLQSIYDSRKSAEPKNVKDEKEEVEFTVLRNKRTGHNFYKTENVYALYTLNIRNVQQT